MYKYALFAILLFSSCKKDAVSEVKIAEELAGTYPCLKYAFFWSNLQPLYFFDSIPQVMLTIENKGSGVVSIEDKELSFYQYLNGHYYFIGPIGASKKTIELMVSEKVESFRYKMETGGMGGGSGYIYEWKQ